MVRGTSPPRDSRFRPLLRTADQVTVAVLVVSCLVSILLHWYWQASFHQQLIEFDHAEPLQIQFQIQLNSADWPEFTLLPGIGETLARRIVDYRQQHGPFKTLDHLEGVKGIGPKTLRRIGPYLIVD